jgi:hypothetical protein
MASLISIIVLSEMCVNAECTAETLQNGMIDVDVTERPRNEKEELMQAQDRQAGNAGKISQT